MRIRSEWDTIAAISTPYGESGIGIVRISGPRAKNVASKLFRPKQRRRRLESHRVTYGEIVDPGDNTVIDEVLLLFMAKPRTYTREDVLEIHCHGGSLVMGKILESTLREGVRLAEPGEFTKRAFLNGRIDLAQAEAVIATIRAKTPAGLRIANEQLRGRLSGEILEIKERLVSVLAEIEAHLDFSDEDLGGTDPNGMDRDLEGISDRLASLAASFEGGRVLSEGIAVAIVGKTNVGKSSLLNRLLGSEKAIVTEVAGTTRDVIEDTVRFSGLTFRIIDTAGIRKWRNLAEREAMGRTTTMIQEADMVLLMVDRTRPLSRADNEIFGLIGTKEAILVVNKMDLPSKLDPRHLQAMAPGIPMAEISALTGEGIEDLKRDIAEVAFRRGMAGSGDGTVVFEVRHKRALEEAREALERAKQEAGRGFSSEIVALEIRCALNVVGEIVGESVSEDILDRVFSQFCVGK
jgi:tRNA modification GTPase